METINGYTQEMPDMRFTATGLAITKLVIADTLAAERESYKYIICWAELAEQVAQFLDVNEQLYLKGYWKKNEWQDDKGNMHSRNEFTARQIWWVQEDGTYLDVMNLEKAEV